ncbi:MAG: type I secretion system permease/ATPase [Rhodocyclaceae bacterium]
MKTNSSASGLRAEVRLLRRFFLPSLGLSVIVGLLSLAPSIYMLEVYGRVVDSRSLTTLLMLTLAVIGAYAVMETLEWLRARILRQAGEWLDDRLAGRVFAAVYLTSLRSGQSASQQALADLRVLRDFVSSPALVAVMEFPLIPVVMTLLFMIHPLLGSFTILGGVMQATLAFLMEQRTQPPLALANKSAVAAQNYAGNSFRNAQVIEAMGMLDGIWRRWMQRQNEFLRQQAIASDHAGGLSATAKAVQMVTSSALLGIGCWLLLEGRMGDAGLMIVASILGGKSLQPVVHLLSNWRAVVEARGAFARLDELLRAMPEERPRMALPAPRGWLSVEAVTAGAPGSMVPILRNVSFALPAGECLAVVGPSASGKSTLARLLVGVWPTLSGKVRLDGADVFAWDKEELGPWVGYLPQGVELFDGTLAENIARFGAVEMDKVEAAGSLLGIDELAAELPEGYHSRIGEDGAFLSGGQRQRVGLARAIYGWPRFVVLDEPNSSLDEGGEIALLHMLRELKARGVTVVIITHRANVLAAADRMLLLINGMVQAYGPRDEVLAALKRRETQTAQPRSSSATGTLPAV